MRKKQIEQQAQLQKKYKNQFDSIINKTPFLKKLKDGSNGLKHSDITTGTTSQEYKDNYDQIDWGKKLDKPKSYRTKINGKYVDD